MKRERAEEALRRRERLLAFAIDQLPVPVIIAEAPEVSITRINEPALELMVASTDDAKEIPLAEHREHWPTFHPDGRPYRIEDLPLTQAIKQGKITKDREILVRHGDEEHSNSQAGFLCEMSSTSPRCYRLGTAPHTRRWLGLHRISR